MTEQWQETTLGDIAEVVMGRQLSPAKRLGVRPRRYLRAANIQPTGIDLEDILEMDFTEKEESKFGVKPGDVLLVEGGNEKSVGCPALVTEREAGLCIQNTVVRCRPIDQEISDPRFLYHFLRKCFLSGDFAQLATGTTIMHLGQRRAAVFPVQLPSNPEQRRMVDLIESVDSYIDALRVQADAARTARASLLHELLIDMSGDWTETTLDALGTWRSGGTPKAGTPRFYGGDIPFVAIGDLTGGVIRTTEKTLTPVGLAEIGHLAPEGSIFVSMYGSIGKIGVAGANMATNQAIAWLEPDLTVIDPAFMTSWLINHAAVFDSQGRGATQRNINRKMIRETPIVLPPLPTQNEIAHTVESINNLIDRTEEALSRSATVSQGILAELLSGNHEIPESYDALLEAS